MRYLSDPWTITELPSRWALRARWTLPVSHPPVEDATVIIESGRIVGIVRTPPDVPVWDAGNAIVMPSMINAHTHLEFSDLTHPIASPDGSFASWIREVVEARMRRAAESDAEDAVRRGWLECVSGGAARVGEITTGHPPPVDLPAGGIAFQEILGLRRTEEDARIATVESHLQAPSHGVWQAGVSPHAPYSLHWQTFLRVVALAAECDAPVAMHLAESRDEMQLLRERSGPLRDLFQDWGIWDESALVDGACPGDYLRQLAHTCRVFVIHGNYLSDDELQFLAARRDRFCVVHCPRTHAHFEHDVEPLSRMLRSGVKVILGTDSRASTPTLRMTDELRFLASLPHAPPAEQMLRMATRDATTAFGWHAKGALEAGLDADLLLLRRPEDCADRPLDWMYNDTPLDLCMLVAGQPLRSHTLTSPVRPSPVRPRQLPGQFGEEPR